MSAVTFATSNLGATPPDPRALYGEGKEAYDIGDFGKALTAFSSADELLPNASVLELAIICATKADDPTQGMRLVDRAAERGLDGIVRVSRPLFEAKVGRLQIACPGATRCAAAIDGREVPLQAPVWVRAGDHAVTLDADGNVERFHVNVGPRDVISLRPTRVLRVQVPTPVLIPSVSPAITLGSADAAARSPDRSTRRPVGKGWFFVAAGVTTALGGAALASGIDTLETHDAFLARRQDMALAREGAAADRRTTVLLVSTGVMAVATAVLGIGFVDWTRSTRKEVGIVF